MVPIPSSSTARRRTAQTGDGKSPVWARIRRDPSSLILLVLALAFLGRVLAQVIQAVGEVGFLPEFDAWQSGALPYPVLLASQIVILALQVLIIIRVRAERLRLTVRSSLIVAGLGAAYFGFMAFRLVAGFTFLQGHEWFDAPLPSTFHLVLASFVMATAWAGWGADAGDGWALAESRFFDWATYPAVVAGALLLAGGAQALGLPAPVSSYGAVAVAAVVIIVLEVLRPYRRQWLPDARSVANDAGYLVLVQMVFPLVVSSAAVFALASISRDLEVRVQGWWPHSWPVVAQILLMLFVGDLARYWLHRAFHRWPSLWAYHAVHHSPPRLYWLNVGRFHPVDKGGQLLFDSIPFILVGVSDEVLAGYFVFYAVNGFFQHSNCRVSLGWLNYLISGPELHRWHHSRKVAESDTNFGNNLIIWDLAFGTRFLPPDQEVGELGLLNRHYPDGFISQMAAPFHPGLDKASA